jgi:hypothetical protein
MPHYKDGSPAKVGDFVKGRGCNVKGPDGELKEIFGQVVSITTGAETCNVMAAHLTTRDLPDFKWPDYGLFHTAPGVLVVSHEGKFTAIQACTEFGQADQFEKVG